MTNHKPHILIVDDDIRIGELLSRLFKQEHFYTSIAHNVTEAEHLMQYFVFDLMILDVMMPGVTGLEFAHIIKSQTQHVPVIMLTALGEPEDRIKGLEAGVDDYLPKPFNSQELLLRAKNLIEIYGFNKIKAQSVHMGNVIYNVQTRNITRNNENIYLTSSEKNLLTTLIENKEKIISRQDIAEKLGGMNERSIDVMIKRLRDKIEEDPSSPKHIQTLRNKGYILHAN